MQMTKSLTEQWKDGELKSGMYYLKMTDTNGSISRDEYFHPYGFVNWLPEDIKEVLAPVPSYNEYKEMDNDLKEIASKNDSLAMECGKLQEQLKEANNVICALFPLSMNKIKATDCVYRYMEKWGEK